MERTHQTAWFLASGPTWGSGKKIKKMFWKFVLQIKFQNLKIVENQVFRFLEVARVYPLERAPECVQRIYFQNQNNLDFSNMFPHVLNIRIIY